MKWHIKLAIVIALAVAVAAFVLMYKLYQRDPLVRKTAVLPEVSGKELFSELDGKTEDVHFKRRTSTLPEHEPAAERSGLTGNIQQCALKMICSLLPEDSNVNTDGGLELLSGDCALISGTAAVPAQNGHGEKHYRFTVKVYFLPNGSCEAEFPEFKAVSSK